VYKKGLVCFISWLAFVSCGKLVDMPSFRLPLKTDATTKKFQWEGPSAIDGGAYEVNRDRSEACHGVAGGGSELLDSAWGRGCMESPQVMWSDSRWHVGFTQNYLGYNTGGATPTLYGFSALVNMTSLTTGLFGTYGSGLGAIDPGGGLANPPTGASRYIRFAKLPNGNIVAVYWVDDDTVRTVYGSVYDASLNTWGSVTQLGTAAVATDFGTYYTLTDTHYPVFCRPTVAASGDNTAMVSWCEVSGGFSVVRYMTYSSVSGWAASSSLLISTTTTTSLPGISADSARLYQDDNAIWTGVGLDDVATIAVSDVASASITYDVSTTDYLDIASVAAVTTAPAAGQFQIVQDTTTSGFPTLMCPTLQNMANALLSKTVVRFTAPATLVSQSSTLSQLGVSMRVDPSCSNTSSSTWNITTYYNKNLSNTFQTPAVLSISVNRMALLRPVLDLDDFVALDPNGVGSFLAQPTWQRSDAVDLAGDGYGNYAFIRTLVAPYFPPTDIASVNYSSQLVGHEYYASGGLRADSNSRLVTKLISRNPVCYNQTTDAFTGCPAKMPRLLMSNSGEGLVLYYQRQYNLPYAGASSWPMRLWYGTYGISTGFSNVAGAVDHDVYCSSASAYNDSNVCQTGSYTSGASCQIVDVTTSFPLASIDHDVPPIPVAMNQKGNAVLAYHKTDCTTVRTYITFFDPFNGFSSPVAVDDGLGHTMHANVAIEQNGDAAVVWEEIVGGSTYVNLRRYLQGAWSSQERMNDSGHTTPEHSMMPSVGFNGNGEVLVTYTHAASGGTRRQYIQRFYYY